MSTAVENLTLVELESIIEESLTDERLAWVKRGAALRDVQERRLYEEFGTFENYCEKRWGFTRDAGYKYIRAAEAAKNVESILHSAPSLTQAIHLSALTPDQQREVAARTNFAKTTVRALRETVQAAIKAAAIRKPCEPGAGIVECGVGHFYDGKKSAVCPYCMYTPDERQAYAAREKMGVHYSSESPEWYTPKEILVRVVRALGSIDLDPCSNSKESPNVPCAACFTQAEDGLSKGWAGRVYMNPPYGREIGPWVEKLVAEYVTGRTTQAIALVPARVDTDWFRQFRDYAICFIDGRLKFSGHQNSAPFPSALVYLGGDIDRFYDAFADIGDVWIRWQK